MAFKCKITEHERELLLQWLKEGIGYTEIAHKLDGKLSKQRIKQIAQKHGIDAFKIRQARKTKEYTDKMFAKNGSKWNDPEFTKSLIFQSMKEKFRNKKSNKYGWEWTIEFGDLEFPSHCPVLGIELDYFTEGKGRMENSVSFDRIDPTKGYIKGNVIVMSWRANRIKNNGTSQEHQQIADFMRSSLL
jgi:hypothetical protein